MLSKMTKYSIRVIRSLAVALGIIVLGLSIFLIFQNPKYNEMPPSIVDRVLISLPYIGFGALLVIPYKKIHNKWFFYEVFLGFIAYIIILILFMIEVSRNPGVDFDTYKAEPISIVLFIFFIFNYWAFSKITGHVKLSFIVISSVLLLISSGLIFLHFAPSNFDIPYKYSWHSEYGTALGEIYKDEITAGFVRKMKIPQNQWGEIKIIFEKTPLKTSYKGRNIYFNLIINYLGKDYSVRVKGKRYWIRQFYNWEVIKVDLKNI